MGVHLWSGRLYIYAGNKEGKRTKWKSKNRVYLFSSFCKYIKSLNYAELEKYIKTFYFSVLRKARTELSLGDFLKEYKKLLTNNHLDSSDYKIHRAYVFYCNCRNSNVLNFSKRKNHSKKQDSQEKKDKRKRVIKVERPHCKEGVRKTICIDCKRLINGKCSVTNLELKYRSRCLLFTPIK